MMAHASEPTCGTSTTTNTVQRTLGLAKDGVLLAKPAIAAGFGIAHACVDASFSIPRKVAPYMLLRSPVDLAYSITRQSLYFSSFLAQSSLNASDCILTVAGAQQGETYRVLKEYVDSQSHTQGHDTREALLGVAALLVQVGMEIDNPLQLIQGTQKLAELHESQRQERIAKRQTERTTNTSMTTKDWSSSLYLQYATAIYGAQAALTACCGSPFTDDIIIPHPSELTNLSRHMRYAAAAYGAKSCKFMGCCESLAYWASDEDAIVKLCHGVQKQDIMHMAQERHELYRPAHFVAIQHIQKELVIAIRGTMSMHDVLVDLVCQNVTFETVYDHGAATIQGKAHGGFLKSAQTLANDLHQLVAETLRDNPEYQLVIVGHSLGGGVATLLALLWARIPEFRQRNVRAIAYASPCVVCARLSQAPFVRRHVTSVVTGDDIVSRFSLSTFRELQRNMRAMANEAETRNDGDAMDVPPVRLPTVSNKADSEEKLYCAGRVWWLESKEYEPHPIVEVDPVKELSEVGLFADMFAIHLPKSYLDSLDKLDRRHAGAVVS